MAQHSNYWSSSPFADWIRGTKKLSAGTSEEWDDWTTRAQMKHNFRYWLAEEADLLVVLIVLPLIPGILSRVNGRTWGTAFCLVYSMSWWILLR